MEFKKFYIDGNQYVYSSNPTKKLNRRWQVVDNFNIKREVKKVKVKEAIEFLEIEIKSLEVEIEDCCPDDDLDIQVIEANKEAIIKNRQIISLLQQGEAYRQMWEHISVIYKGHGVESDIKALEQKYLKEAKQDEG